MSYRQDCLTVSTLNAKIRGLLEEELSNIWVKGEMSNFHYHPASGHMYFTIKDNSSEIRCTMFRMNNLHLNFKPEDGMEVRIYGNVTVYEKKGQVQLKVGMMEESGKGDLYRSFELLKKSLQAEGLFDESHKKRIPSYPKKVGILTSGSGAAYQDIINVLNRRAPHIEIVLHSVKVQGIGSSHEVASGIDLFNKDNSVELLIISRGGGSIEDLWTFNEESVARAIFKSHIPIISGIGHETDFTIADFVSDLRAPTPSAAAELAVPLREDLLRIIKNFKSKMSRNVYNQLEQRWLFFDQIEKRISNQRPSRKIEIQVQTLNQNHQRMLLAIEKKHTFLSEKINYLFKQLSNLGPDHVLDRGYAIPIDERGKVIRSSNQIKVGESFRLNMAKDGIIAKKTSNTKPT
tara:strand:+ start:799 stop:2010 length:1212 start_codon:yes stop_codon:yes gene_type:complete